MGSLLMPKIGQEISIEEKKRVNNTFMKLKNGYEKFAYSLAQLLNQ